MSLVLKPTIVVTINFRDNDGKDASTSVKLPAATTAAAALTYAAAFVPLLAATSAASVTGYSVGLEFIENALGAIGSSDVEDKGVFNFLTATGFTSSISVPGFSEDLLLSNNEDIDLANADVSDFVDAVVAGLSGTQPAALAGGDLIAVKAAYKQNTRSHLSKRIRKG